MHFSVAYSAAGATGFLNYLSGSNTGTASYSVSALGAPTAPNYGSASSTDFGIFIKGIVVTGVNTGNITVQIDNQTSGTATVYIGSRLTVYKLSP
jgi:hypothetical protein